VFFRPRPLPELVERSLTSNSNEDSLVDSAISPDGKYLAYANRRHVLILNVADRAIHTLPNLDRLSVFHLTWTHDSTRLLVVGYEKPGATSSLWQVSILGNDEPQKVSENVYNARESPDGKSRAGGLRRAVHRIVRQPGKDSVLHRQTHVPTGLVQRQHPRLVP
jgi:WD40 repeat protein